MEPEQTYWRKCTTCKKPIGFGSRYWVCSVSTCNRMRTGLVFCEVSCFDAHVPVLNHKDAGAIEKRAPAYAEQNASEILKKMESAMETNPTTHSKKEVLVVVSKTKDYVKASSGMNTSDAVMQVLSDKIRTLLDEAIRHAQQDGRKTVMDRDFT